MSEEGRGKEILPPEAAARWGGGLVLALGAVVLLGWALGIPVLKSVHPALISMKPNTAACFVAAGASLWLLSRGPGGRARGAVRLVLAAGVCLAGLGTLTEYALDADFGVDQVLFRDDPGAIRTSHPGRMSPVAALSFVLLSAGLVAVGGRGGGFRRIADALVLVAALLGLLAVLGYAFGAESLSALLGYSPMALHTAAAIVVLGGTILLTRPGEGIFRILVLDTPESTWARRLIAAAIVVPPLLGWLRLQGQAAGLYGTAFGTAAYAMAMIVSLGAVVLWGALSMERVEAVRRRAEAETRDARERLQAILDHASTVVYLKDLQGRYFLVNREFERVVQRPRERILGATDEDLVGAEAAARVRAEDRRALEEGARTYEMTVTVPAGERTFLVSKFPLEDAERGRVLCGVSVDITDRKRMEEDLRTAKEAAEAANRELEAFSYAVSHDLRAPLRALDGFSLALLEDHGERLDAKGRDYLGRVRGAAQRMGVLIDDLLDLSRVSRADLVRETVDLTGTARSVAEGLKARDPNRAVEWTIRDGVSARGDPRLLRVVLENLLENAWKYTSRRALARIEFGVAEEDGTREYFVRDDGVGFDREYAGRLFAPFQRLHAAREFPGTGIGLATVKRIVDRHGGRVGAEGRPDAGAVFRFTLGKEDAP